VCTAEGRRKGCGLLRGAGRGVTWCEMQEGVWTAEGDRKWCRLVREARRGVHCRGALERVWTARHQAREEV
jgi:hypothetical protein